MICSSISSLLHTKFYEVRFKQISTFLWIEGSLMIMGIRVVRRLAWLIGVFLLTDCSSVRQAELPVEKVEAAETIYVTRRGWHTGILLPSTALDPLFPSIIKQMPRATHVAFSWGDRRYFMAGEGTLGLAIRAALFPTQSVVHVEGYNWLPQRYINSENVLPMHLSEEGLRLMIDYIRESFERDSRQQIIPLRQNEEGMSHFYLSHITYWGTRTCNVWTARALAKAGVDIHPALSLTAGRVMRQLKEQK